MTTQRPRTYDPPRPRTVTVDGARVACWEAGPPDAEPVVLLHGYPADHRCWRHQVPPLSARHRVITPDLLGWGASDRPCTCPSTTTRRSPGSAGSSTHWTWTR